jgi:hypothetical protein
LNHFAVIARPTCTSRARTRARDHYNCLWQFRPVIFRFYRPLKEWRFESSLAHHSRNPGCTRPVEAFSRRRAASARAADRTRR